MAGVQRRAKDRLHRTYREGVPYVRMLTTTVVAILLAATPQGFVAQQGMAQSEGDISRVWWMTGCWRAESGVEELWTDGAGGQMFGLNRSFRDGQVRRWEFLRIYQGRTKLIFAAAPSHQPPTEFEATVATADSVAFHNLEHDFPTGITYRPAAGDSLIASVSGPGDDGTMQLLEIRFGRVSCDEPPEQL